MPGSEVLAGAGVAFACPFVASSLHLRDCAFDPLGVGKWEEVKAPQKLICTIVSPTSGFVLVANESESSIEMRAAYECDYSVEC